MIVPYEIVFWIVFTPFRVINKRPKNDDAENEEKYQKHQLFGAGAKSMNENF